MTQPPPKSLVTIYGDNCSKMRVLMGDHLFSYPEMAWNFFITQYRKYRQNPTLAWDKVVIENKSTYFQIHCPADYCHDGRFKCAVGLKLYLPFPITPLQLTYVRANIRAS